MTRLDWAGMLRNAVQGAGLRPDEFWALTPAEFLLMLGPQHGVGPMTRDGLEALAARFPDRTETRI